MRVDRLVSVLLLLQARGHVTAAEVAAELEVSERTARRDLDGLITAGLPVYSVRGRGGGWRLAGGGRTDLSGLTADEARALMLAVESSTHLGASVRSGLRKLQRALPDPLRATAEATAAVTIVDDTGWERNRAPRRRTPPPCLDAVHRATVDAERIEIEYVDRGGTPTRRAVDPRAVVNHAGTWYLLAATELGDRTFRIDRMTTVTRTGTAAARPDGYDAAAAWREAASRIDALRAPVVAEGRARSEVLVPLRWVLGRRLEPTAAADGQGWVPCRFRGHRAHTLAVELAGFGASVVVTGPDEVRQALAEIGDALLSVYGGPGTTHGGADGPPPAPTSRRR